MNQKLIKFFFIVIVSLSNESMYAAKEDAERYQPICYCGPEKTRIFDSLPLVKRAIEEKRFLVNQEWFINEADFNAILDKMIKDLYRKNVFKQRFLAVCR